MTVGLFGVRVVVMSENVGKLVGVVVMAVLVVVGVAVSSGDDTNFTRNAAFVKLGDFQQLPEAEQARLAPAFLEQAAPKALDTGPINKINKEVGPIFKGATGYKLKNVIVTSLEASVLEGKGVDGKGGTSSFFSRGLHNNGAISGSSGTAGSTSSKWREDGAGRVVSGQDIEAIGGVEGVAERIGQCVGSSFPSVIDNTRASNLIPNPAVTFGAAAVLKNVLVSSYTATADGNVVAFIDKDDFVRNLAPQEAEGLQEACANGSFLQGSLTVDTVPFELSGVPLLLAECMESKVGDVFLKSHIESTAADCVATVMPALSPDRAKRLGTYWQTQEQLARIGSEHCWPCE